ncbi:calcitonin receptor-like protein, partial [Leptotrombidium deliense]
MYLNVRNRLANELGTRIALSTFKHEFHRKLFENCCEQAENCCVQHLKSQTIKGNNETQTLSCPAKWDGWSCWNRTSAGIVAKQLCVDFAYQTHERLPEHCLRGFSEKKCEANGTWFSLNGVEYTDYVQ